MTRDEELNAPTSIGKASPQTTASTKNAREQVNGPESLLTPFYIGVKKWVVNFLLINYKKWGSWDHLHAVERGGTNSRRTWIPKSQGRAKDRWNDVFTWEHTWHILLEQALIARFYGANVGCLRTEKNNRQCVMHQIICKSTSDLRMGKRLYI